MIGKSNHETHGSLEGKHETHHTAKAVSFTSVLIQIAIIDIVFSLDSVITAVGLAEDVPVMITAIVIAVLVMMFSAKAIGDFADEHPRLKMLALSFLILVGMVLFGEGLEPRILKGYIYFTITFSIIVELLNMKIRQHSAKKS